MVGLDLVGFLGFPGVSTVMSQPANAGTWVLSLVWEDPACHAATKPMHHNCWAWALEPGSCNYWATCHNYWSPCIHSLCSTTEATLMRILHTPAKRGPGLPQLEKSLHSNKDSAQEKSKMIKKWFKKCSSLFWQDYTHIRLLVIGPEVTKSL